MSIWPFPTKRLYRLDTETTGKTSVEDVGTERRYVQDGQFWAKYGDLRDMVEKEFVDGGKWDVPLTLSREVYKSEVFTMLMILSSMLVNFKYMMSNTRYAESHFFIEHMMTDVNMMYACIVDMFGLEEEEIKEFVREYIANGHVKMEKVPDGSENFGDMYG